MIEEAMEELFFEENKKMGRRNIDPDGLFDADERPVKRESYEKSDGEHKKILYHYTSQGAITNILRDDYITLRCTFFECFNDISEGKVIKEVQDEVCRCLIFNESDDVKREFLRKLKRTGLESLAFDIRENTELNQKTYSIIQKGPQSYICCFSNDPDSLPMWNYYSKDGHYEGYNIGLEIDDINEAMLENKLIKNSVIRDVIYDKKEQKKLVHKLIKNQFGHACSLEGQDVPEEYKIELINLSYIFKSSVFEHEKETRLICEVREPEAPLNENKEKSDNKSIDINKDDPRIHFYIRHGVAVPYVEIKLKKSCLKSVTIGPSIEQKLGKKTFEMYLKENGYGDVKVNISKLPIRF